MYTDQAFAPFGENYAQTGNKDLDFTGQIASITDGLYDFWYREYHAKQGRWISPDPAGMAAADPTNPQSWNRYSYVVNNPLKYVDPLGLRYCLNDKGEIVECQGGGGRDEGSLSDEAPYPNDNGPDPFLISIGPHGRGERVPPANNCTTPGSNGCYGPPKACANVPAIPPGASATFNANLVSLETEGMWPATKLDFFYQVFKTGGAFDYKANGRDQYVNYGNWNFGYVCGANYPGLFCQSAAGGNRMWRAAMQRTNPFGSGFPFLKSPYGDQAADNQQIRNGIQAQASGCVQ
jgi:RHS repeat-associated protein